MTSFETVTCFECQWKVTGINQTISCPNWVGGTFMLERNKELWRCGLSRISNMRRPPITYTLTRKIKEIHFKNRVLIELRDGTSLHIKVPPESVTELAKYLDVIRENKPPPQASVKTSHLAPIHNTDRTPPRSQALSRTTVSSTAATSGLSTTSQANKSTHNGRSPLRSSPINLIDDTENVENVSEFQDNEPVSMKGQNSSQNRLTKTPNRFLENSRRKSSETLTNLGAKRFYSASAPTRTYSMLSSYSRSSAANNSGGGITTYSDVGKRPRLGDLGNSPSYRWKTQSGLSPSPGSAGLHGFSNLGNTCYMNAILQSLLTLDTFSDDLRTVTSRLADHIHTDQRKSYLSFMLSKLAQLKRRESCPPDVKKHLLAQVKRAISSSARRFSGYEQHDAHEFLGQILDQLKEEVLKVHKKISKKSDAEEQTPTENGEQSPEDDGSDSSECETSNPTIDNFEFKVAHQITCTECLERLETEERFHDLSIDMPPKKPLEPTSSIQDALDHFFLPEDLEYTCEQCGGKTGRVQHKFARLPRVLILHLKRYTYDNVTSSNTKLGQNIIIPKYLTLKNQCEETTESALRPSEPSSNDADQKLMLTPTPETDRSAHNSRRLSSSTSRRKLDLGGTDAPEIREPQKLSSNDDDIFMWTENSSSREAETEAKPSGRQRLDSLTIKSMSEEEMMKIAVERSLSETSGPGSPVTRRSPNRQAPASASVDKPRTSDDVICIQPSSSSELSGDSLDQLMNNSLHPQQQDTAKYGDIDTTLTVVANQEPPLKRTKLDECSDSAYSSLTDDSSEERSVPRHDRTENSTNSSAVAPSVDETPAANSDDLDARSLGDMKLSDEEDKENHLPGNTQATMETETPKLQKKEELDEEAQIQQAIANSLRDQERLMMNDEDDLQKAKELSLQDTTPTRTRLHETVPMPTMSWNLKRTKEEEKSLVRHAEFGDLPHSYQLVSVVSHLGSTSRLGHYVSDVYDARQRSWISWDDTRMSSIQEEDVRKTRERTGYIFFYMSKETVQELEELYYQQRRQSRMQSLSSSLPS